MWKKGIQAFLVFLILSGAMFPLMLWAYRQGNIATWTTGVIFFILAIFFLINSKGNDTRSIFSGLFGGYFAWAFAGEVMVHLGFLPIDQWISVPLLIIFTIFTFFIIKNNITTSGVQFFIGHFNIIWLLHVIMMTEYHFGSKRATSTYWTAGIFLLFFIYSFYRMMRSRTKKEGFATGITTLYTFWTIVEFIKGWF